MAEGEWRAQEHKSKGKAQEAKGKTGRMLLLKCLLLVDSYVSAFCCRWQRTDELDDSRRKRNQSVSQILTSSLSLPRVLPFAS